MPSNSEKKFKANCKDIHRLMEIHSDMAGEDRGRKYGVEVLNKSAVVLICAVWEAYVEDLIGEALDHFTANLTNPISLPKELRKIIAEKVKTDKNELAPWDLSGTGWKLVLTANLESMKKQFTGAWHSPKAAQVDQLIEKTLGLPSVTDCWKRTTLTPKIARQKLDEYVRLRGDIAHRNHAAEAVTKADATAFLEHVTRLVEFTDKAINEHVLKITGKPLF